MFDFNQVLCTCKFVMLTMFAVGCVFCLSEVESLSQQSIAIREHKCAVPQARTISFEDEFNLMKRNFTINCELYPTPIAVLHRCDFASGCCVGFGGKVGTCKPVKKDIQNVTLVFYAFRKDVPRCSNTKMAGRRTIKIQAENHTRCDCSW